MKKRLEIGKLLKGDKRLDGETFVEYKDRLKLEKSLLNDYGKGVYISPQQHQQERCQQCFRGKSNITTSGENRRVFFYVHQTLISEAGHDNNTTILTPPTCSK